MGMNMKMKSVSGVICLVKDLERSKEFYEKLGFDFRKEVPGVAVTAYLNWFWIEFLSLEKVVTEAFKEDIPVSPKGAGQSVHINVENVDEFYKGILGLGFKPSGEPEDYSWGHREFVLSDPDGYKLVFFQKK